MSPEVTAAIIAASVSFITLIGTLAAQYFGRRATSRDTKMTLQEQGKQLDRTLEEQRKQLNTELAAQGEHLDRTLTEQREQLDRTLEEQRKQLDRTLAEQRTRTLNERFAAAAGQLGSDKPPEVRLAGVYAMAGLADDWEDKRQTCIDVLCGYLRMPYEPDPGEEAPGPERLAFGASQQVRHTVIRLIGAHLRPEAKVSWQGQDFDFTGVVFDGCDFGRAQFSGGWVNFRGAEFSGGQNNFTRAVFSGADVWFMDAVFSGGVGEDGVGFDDAVFSGGQVHFYRAEFSGGRVSFNRAKFSGSLVSFIDAKVSSSQVWFYRAKFSGGGISFEGAAFSGGEVHFEEAEFSGGAVDFTSPGDWSVPPAFSWTGTPPQGVKLPVKHDQSHA